MIRRHLASAALGLSLVLSAPAMAQAPAPVAAPTAAHVQVALEVVQLTGLAQSFDAAYTEFRERTLQLVGVTRPELSKDMNEVIVALKPEADRKRDEMTLTAADIYARKLTETELKDIAAFFKSPVGQRYNTARGAANDEIYTVLQTWSLQTSDFMFDRFTEEMRKRGHQM